MVKKWFLLLNTENEGELIKGKIENGFAELKKMMFSMDGAFPIRVRRGLIGESDLYIIKWDNIKPAYNVHADRRLLKEVEEITPQKIERINPKFFKLYDMTPEQLRKMMGMKILGNMIKVKKETNMKPLFAIILIALVAGLSVFALQMFGIVKFW